MIVRILGYGQFRLSDDAYDELNDADERIEAAVTAGDTSAFALALSDLVAVVLGRGEMVGPGEFVSSEAVIPTPGTSLEDVRGLLSSEGLVPDAR